MVSKSRYNKKRIVWVALTIILVGVVFLALQLTNVTHFFHNSAVVRAPSAPITKLPTPSSSARASKNPNTPTSSVNQGTSTDNNGQIPSSVTTTPSQWSTSTSGVIVVKSPTENSTFTSGEILAGTATVKKVQYTLIDNQYGVTSQGFINVASGNFSAGINFSYHSSAGRLDVFSTDSNGKEINEVQIDVNF